MISKKIREYIENRASELNRRIDFIINQLNALINDTNYRQEREIQYRITLYTLYLEGDLGFLMAMEQGRDFHHVMHGINEHLIKVSVFIDMYDVPIELVNLFDDACAKYRLEYYICYGYEPPCYDKWMKSMEKYKNTENTNA